VSASILFVEDTKRDRSEENERSRNPSAIGDHAIWIVERNMLRTDQMRRERSARPVNRSILLVPYISCVTGRKKKGRMIQPRIKKYFGTFASFIYIKV
jgi:hypothetical protein